MLEKYWWFVSSAFSLETGEPPNSKDITIRCGDFVGFTLDPLDVSQFAHGLESVTVMELALRLSLVEIDKVGLVIKMLLPARDSTFFITGRRPK